MSSSTSNGKAARTRRLSDPDFQAMLVERSMTLATLMSIVVAVFAVHDVWVWQHPPQPKYFYVDGRTAARPATALDSPIVDDTELLQWTVKWAIAPYNINWHDFPSQLNEASRYYTPAGWNTFVDSFTTYGSLNKMKQARLLCYAQPTRAAIIKATKVQFGRLGYLVQVPVVQTCENSNEQHTQILLLNATVQRVDTDRDHPDGMAISQLVATLQ